MKRLLVAGLLLVLSGCGYNKIQSFDEQINAYASQIEVQLQRRYDLIPNLVTVVREYAQHEEDVFTAVADARAKLGGAIKGGDPAQMADASQTMTSALGRLLVIAEAYPELKANENYRSLQDQLEGTENRVAVARRDFNEAVRQYNSYIRRFPQVLTAKAIGASPRNYFDLTNKEAREAPKIQPKT